MPPARPLMGLLVLLPALAFAAASPGLEHPLAPSRLALRDGASRRVSFEARWRGQTAPVDPTAHGATLRIAGGTGEGDTGAVALDAERWKSKGGVLRYRDPAGKAAGIRSVVLRIGAKGGSVRMAGRGAWPYALDRPQSEIT